VRHGDVSFIRGAPVCGVSRVCRGVVFAVIVEAGVYPSFAKEGWTRPKNKCCEASFVERTGWLFQATAY